MKIIEAEPGDPRIEIKIPEIIKITIKKLKIGDKYIFHNDFFIFGSSLYPNLKYLSFNSIEFKP